MDHEIVIDVLKICENDNKGRQRLFTDRIKGYTAFSVIHMYFSNLKHY